LIAWHNAFPEHSLQGTRKVCLRGTRKVCLESTKNALIHTRDTFLFHGVAGFRLKRFIPNWVRKLPIRSVTLVTMHEHLPVLARFCAPYAHFVTHMSSKSVLLRDYFCSSSQRTSFFNLAYLETSRNRQTKHQPMQNKGMRHLPTTGKLRCKIHAKKPT
jgi:hypothetical protein